MLTPGMLTICAGAEPLLDDLEPQAAYRDKGLRRRLPDRDPFQAPRQPP